ncbi:hypothetical protein JCM8547_003596 [Rhodosporidiobolus lusitaniae]
MHPADPPDDSRTVPAPLQETLAAPLAAASAREEPEVAEHVESKEERDETGSDRTVVSDAEGKEGGDKDGRRGEGEEGGENDGEPAQIADWHANGLADQTAYMPVRQILIVFASIQLCVLLAFLDQTIVSTALPNISAAFNAGRSSSFVAAAYLLTSCALQPVWGRLSDVFGRKITLIACVAFFLLGSLACAVAQSMTQLIILRGLQGVGGGGLLTLVLIIISDIVSLKDRGRYQGLTEVTILIGNGLGPILGGVLVEHASWRWCFWINLPVSAVSIVIIALFLPLKKVKGSAKEKLLQIDYGGAVLTVAATVLMILPLQWGGTSFAWVSGPVLGCLISSFFAFGIFILYERKVARIPVVPPFIFKNRTVAAIFLTTFFSGATILVQLYYLPQLFQVVQGVSATRSGVLLIPQLVMTTVFVAFSGQLVSRTGEYKPSIVIGYAIWVVGLGLLSTLDENSSTARIVGFQLLNGAGQGQTLQTSMVAAQAAVARSEMSVVTSVRNFFRSMGGTIFLVIASTIINNTLRSHLTPLNFSASTISAVIDDPTAIWRSSADSSASELALLDLSSEAKAEIVAGFVQGFHTLFHVLVGLIGFNFVVALLFVQRHDLQRKDEDALKQRGKDWVNRQKEKKKGGADKTLDDAEKGDVAQSVALEKK